jgi:Domain of unknown function (DUF4126)
MDGLDFALPALLGIGLAAASGFRVFVPLLVLGLAAHGGYVPVGESFAWVATPPALAMLAVAALAEIVAYYIPGVDNLLDTIAAPAAIAAGIAVSAAVMADVPPMIKWTLAIIAGGGAAALTQSATTLARGSSTAMTGGLGNPVIATGELFGAAGLSLLAIAAPLIAIGVTAIVCIAAWRLARRFFRRPEGAG